MLTILDVKVGRRTVRTGVSYVVIYGEKAALGNPPSPTEIEIRCILVAAVNDTDVDSHWFNSHPDWTEWLESMLVDIIIDYNNPYIQELIDGYNAPD